MGCYNCGIGVAERKIIITMHNAHIRKRYITIGIIIAAMLAAVFTVSCSTQTNSESDPVVLIIEEAADNISVETEEPIEYVVEKKAAEEEEAKAVTSFAPYDIADEEKVIGDVKVADLFTEIRKVQNKEDLGDWSHISIDMREYCTMGNVKRPLGYAFKDINGDGTEELVVGDENGVPLVIYMVKDGRLHVPELVYFMYGNPISSDGVINTMQGSGMPDDAHKDGYFFRLDTSAKDGIVETERGADEPMQFDWKLLE